MIEMKNVSKKWQKNETQVLNDVSLKIHEGDSIGLMGSSGSGKSTLARILLLLEPFNEGEIYYRGVRLDIKNKRQIKQYRREVQYISQHPESFFDPNWTLGKSVMEAVAIHHLNRTDTKEKIQKLIHALKLNEAILNRYPYQVSGGEIQRAALCRALLLEPKVLILDEATSMLDISVQAQILNILKQIQKKRNLTFLFISHDTEVAFWFANQVLQLEKGKLSILTDNHSN
ncbi:peptide/nickel transport system ATP-binding protein [Lachnotalea glycerini]|uniref:ATP-binding cassette domain-containing protein n=1 Tax=Lachnotalea glycerini TaxID=1763509 RepID=A0A318EYB0_9FIRM|nr:ATP-binding cassette domain-containing protein [Lachnotalea glycerini]PXV91792.1 peptide/nickel transport system ATP-binding protein [Lachnotalea glycerini]RDY31217.1 ATP-binding cassette domain-containing protein [Lachnotalea glycerini]